MWFFKKKDDKLDEIEQKLDKSFLHIKNDMTYLFNKVQEQEHQLAELKSMMSTTEILATQQEQPPSKVMKYDGDEQDYSLKEAYETLTNIHKALLLKMGLLAKENPEQWIPMKVISREMYPNKEYEKIKSMISNYTDNLLNLGFVQKKRIGRQIVMKLTDKGLDCLPEQIKSKRILRKQ